MDSPTPPTDPKAHSSRLDEIGALRALVLAIRHRIVGGLLFALPIVITIWIIYQIYFFLRGVVLDPSARLVTWLLSRTQTFENLPDWWMQVVSPVIAVTLALLVLYFLGYLVGSWLQRTLDWVLFRVPIVTVIYKAVRGIFASLEAPGRGSGFKRVVLVEFPHPGMKALAFVTATLRDPDSGQAILSVCVLTGVMPPSGFTLFVPEGEVVDVDWTVNQALQAILSGGLTTPPLLRYGSGGPSNLIIPGGSEALEEGAKSTL